jgi:hypothetical protein
VYQADNPGYAANRVVELDISALGDGSEQDERLGFGDLESLHQDVLGLSDDAAGGQRALEVADPAGIDHRDGGVVCLLQRRALIIVVEPVRLLGDQLRRAQVVAVHEQLDGQHRADAQLRGGSSRSRQRSSCPSRLAHRDRVGGAHRD